jgi:hypothetical protein
VLSFIIFTTTFPPSCILVLLTTLSHLQHKRRISHLRAAALAIVAGVCVALHGFAGWVVSPDMSEVDKGYAKCVLRDSEIGDEAKARNERLVLRRVMEWLSLGTIWLYVFPSLSPIS